MQQWYERPMRIAALQCNYEDGKNLAVIPRWKAMGFSVEMCVRVPDARPDRLVVHLVNHAGVAPRPFEAVNVQEGLGLRAAARLGVRKARALAAGKSLRLSSDAGGVRIPLPPLAEYEVVVLDTEGRSS